MGSDKKLQVLLLLVSSMYLSVLAASSSIIQKDSSKDIDLGDKVIQQHEHGIRNANSKNYASGGIAYSSKIAHVRGMGGAHTGGSTGTSQHGNNGGSGYPYAGGTASNHHPRAHHGTSSCNRNSVWLFTFILAAVASLVHLYIEWQN